MSVVTAKQPESKLDIAWREDLGGGNVNLRPLLSSFSTVWDALDLWKGGGNDIFGCFLSRMFTSLGAVAFLASFCELSWSILLSELPTFAQLR